MSQKLEPQIKIAEDGMSAMLILPEDFDRTRLDLKYCSDLMVRAGVEVTPENKKLIEQFIEKARAMPAGLFRDVIAKGTPPTHGKDGGAEWAVQADFDAAADAGADGATEAEVPTPPATHADDSEPVSYYNRSAYKIVSAGDVLGTLNHATPGIPGKDVTGKTLPAEDGQPFEFKHDATIRVASDNKIVAGVDGVLDLNGEASCVSDTINVDQFVDFHTGNIDFTGNVLIKEGIRDCFEVKAGQDIEVRGLIEAATVIAGRDLHCLGGFAGREQGHARTEGSLHAKYLDAVSLRVRGELCVAREMINCHAVVLGAINSPRGAIIGGETRAPGRLNIGEIGASGMPLTEVHISGAPHLEKPFNELASIASVLTEQREKLATERARIDKQLSKNADTSLVQRGQALAHELAWVQRQLERIEVVINSLSDRIDGHGGIDLYIQKRLYPNTILSCGRFRYRITSELSGPLHITRDKRGRLMIEVSGKPATLINQYAELLSAA